MNYEKLYLEASEKACKFLERVGGIALGFHSVADGLLVTDEEKLQKLLSDHEISDFSDLPESISSVEDFLKGYLFTFSTGKALQMMIDKKEIKSWIEKNFGKGILKLGGTSANMAVALASFGFKDVLVYAYPLVRELAELFPDMENIKTVSQDGRIVHPRKGWKGEKLGAIHWIFEVKKGQKISLNRKEIVCPRDNRFIASWNPVNSKLLIADHFKRVYLERVSEYPKFMLAGFHIMRDVYPDGETVENRMEDIASFVDEIKKRGAKVHIEMASIRRKRVRKALVDILFPKVDSLGINEVELSWIAEDLRESSEGILEGDPNAVSTALRKVSEKTGIERIHFHTLGYYMLLEKSAEKEKFGLAVAALAAARRAEIGSSPSCDDIKEALRHPLSETGLKASKLSSGDLYILPTKIVPEPKLTVGLGDTISSIAFSLSDIDDFV